MVRIDADGIATGVDEISNYQDMRCIGASEACWRLLEFDMYDRSPRVKSLPVAPGKSDGGALSRGW